MRKIVVIGPESTGKSTASEAIAHALNAPLVPEFARDYIAALDRPYIEADLLAIAKGQIAQEDEIPESAGIMVCDTDLYVIKVWSEHRFGRCDDWVLHEIATRNYDLYLLTDIDMEWEADPQREYPEPEMRLYFYKVYTDIVQHSGIPFIVLSGTKEQRLATALDAIESLLK